MPNRLPDRLVELGRIASAYGIKGWIKIQPHSTQAEALLTAKQWWLGDSSVQAQPVSVVAARPQGSTVVAQIQGVADRTQAEVLRGRPVCVPRSAFPPAKEGEYYWVDLIACWVYGELDGQPVLLGRVSDVSDNGVHAILKVAKLAPSSEDGALADVLDAKGRPIELLIPFVDAHLRAVDLAARRIDTDWPADF